MTINDIDPQASPHSSDSPRQAGSGPVSLAESMQVIIIIILIIIMIIIIIIILIIITWQCPCHCNQQTWTWGLFWAWESPQRSSRAEIGRVMIWDFYHYYYYLYRHYYHYHYHYYHHLSLREPAEKLPCRDRPWDDLRFFVIIFWDQIDVSYYFIHSIRFFVK